MLILLPPSESKATRPRGRSLDVGTLAFPELTEARERVLDELARVSGTPTAAADLGVSPTLTDQIARNTRLRTAPTMPAADLYTGVLYDALDLAGLDTAARRRGNRWIVVQSALFGALRLTDRVPPYRLSMAVNLGEVGPLASFWKPQLRAPLTAASGRGLIVDCRSSTYAAAYTPPADLSARWVQIRVPGASHMAKQTRGLVARAICTIGADPHRPHRLAAALASEFHTRLTPPKRPGSPWVLDTLART